MNQQTEVKKRFKMYKAKKQWVVAPILFLGVLGVVGLATDNVQAAELDSQLGTTTVQPDNPDLQSGKETPKTAVSEEAPVQKDTTSQPTKVEEVASEKNGAEQSSATPNDTTNVQQPTVGAEKSAQEQPVVSPETTNEPLGQPTEVAPAENEANKSTTIPKEFETPDVDKAVDEAKKDPNITVVEKLPKKMQKLRQKTKRKKNATRKKSRNTTNIKMKMAM